MPYQTPGKLIPNSYHWQTPDGVFTTSNFGEEVIPPLIWCLFFPSHNASPEGEHKFRLWAFSNSNPNPSASVPWAPEVNKPVVHVCGRGNDLGFRIAREKVTGEHPQ